MRKQVYGSIDEGSRRRDGYGHLSEFSCMAVYLTRIIFQRTNNRLRGLEMASIENHGDTYHLL